MDGTRLSRVVAHAAIAFRAGEIGPGLTLYGLRPPSDAPPSKVTPSNSTTNHAHDASGPLGIEPDNPQR